MWTRLKDWKTTVPGIAISAGLNYFCPDLLKDFSSPQGIITAAMGLAPVILGVLSHSSKGTGQ